MAAPIIQFRDVRKSYTKKGPKTASGARKRIQQVILSDCTTEFPRDRSVAVLCEDKAERSTLMRLIAGTELPDRGRVLRTGQVSPIGVVAGISKALSARQNCRFISRLYGLDGAKVERFVQEFAELGDRFTSPVESYPKALRGRVSMALSMAPNFDCYLFDGGIWLGDPVVRERARAIFDVKRRSASIILGTNSPTQIRTYCNMAAILHGGRLVVFEDLEEGLRAFQNIGGSLFESDIGPPEEAQDDSDRNDSDDGIF